MRMPGNHGLPSLAAIHPPGLGPDAGSLAWFGAPRRWRNPAACHWTPEDQLGAPGAGMPRSSSPHLGTCIPRPRIASRRVPRRSCPVHPDEPGSRRACCRPGEVSLLGCHLDPERSMHGRGLRCVSRLMGRGLRRSYKGVRWGVGALGRWGVGALGRWGIGALGRWGVGALWRWGIGALGRWGVGTLARRRVCRSGVSRDHPLPKKTTPR